MQQQETKTTVRCLSPASSIPHVSSVHTADESNASLAFEGTRSFCFMQHMLSCFQRLVLMHCQPQ